MEEDTLQPHTFSSATHEIPLLSPIRVGGIEQTQRTCLHLHGIDAHQHVASSELSPLPGLHSTPYLTAHTQLLQCIRECLDMRIPNSIEDFVKQLTDWPTYQASDSSVRFCISSLLLQWTVQSQSDGASNRNYPIQALLWGELSAMKKTLKERIHEGYQTFKIKVGRTSLQDEITFLQELHRELPSFVRLRLDANRAWSLHDALHFSEAVHELPIDYIEEPLHSTQDLLQYASQPCALPLALDETLLDFSSPTDLPEAWKPHIDTLILKPQCIGGIDDILKWIRWAQQNAIQIVWSSCFESSLGIAQIAYIADYFSEHLQPMHAWGLDTERWLHQRHESLVQQGHISIQDAARALRLPGEHACKIEFK